MRLTTALAVAAALLSIPAITVRPEPTPTPARVMDPIAEAYVRLVLALGEIDPDYVDAYYGPPQWRAEVKAIKPPLSALAHSAGTLSNRLKQLPVPQDEMDRLRREYLIKQLAAFQARIRLLQGGKMTFDQQSQALYDSVAPAFSPEHFQELIDKIEVTGALKTKDATDHRTLSQRYSDWRKGFIIPNDKLNEVFQLAIKECRARTLAHLQLPSNESFTVEYVTNKPWGGYNWYKGNYHSVIQVNTDLPTYIDRAVDLAAHEGYPGHHVYNTLLEKNLTHDRRWVEFSVYPLYSPQSLVAEGSANFGREVAFTKLERRKFEKEVLWPAAGLAPSKADQYYEVEDLVDKLSYATNEAARQLIDGKIDAAAAADWLEKYELEEPERAKKRVEFIQHYGSYVINYNYGEDLVRQYIEKHGGTPEQPAKRWKLFGELLASPRLPSDLR